MPVQQTRVTEETAEAGTSLLDIGVCMSAQWRSLLGVPLLALNTQSEMIEQLREHLNAQRPRKAL